MRRIELAVGGLAGKIWRKVAASRVDGGLNVARGGVDVSIEIELQRYARVAKAARGSHLRDAGDAAELPFQRRSHSGGHGLRTRTRQAGTDRNRWKINLRQRRDRQESECNNSRQKYGDGNQRRGHRPSDEWRRKVGRKIHRSISMRRFVRGLLDRVANVKREAMR